MREGDDASPVGCLLLIGLLSALIFIAATIIHYIGLIWLFTIILGSVILLMALR